MSVYHSNPSTAVKSESQASEIRVAAFACVGLGDLSRTLGFPVAVVAAVSDPERHRTRLRDLWYASGVPMRHGDWFQPFDFDEWWYRDWWKIPIDPRWFGGRHHPLAACMGDGDLVLRLPAGVAPRAFAHAFQDGLAPLRFEAVARRPSHVTRMHFARRPVAVTSRYARASPTDQTPVEVRDLVHFEPRCLMRVANVALSALGVASARVGAEAPGRPEAVAW